MNKSVRFSLALLRGMGSILKEGGLTIGSIALSFTVVMGLVYSLGWLASLVGIRIAITPPDQLGAIILVGFLLLFGAIVGVVIVVWAYRLVKWLRQTWAQS